MNAQIIEKINGIKLLLTDCDGVLTDGGIYYSAAGEEMKRFSVRDGMGVERLRTIAGIETGIVTGENSEIVARRSEKLGILEYHPGSKDKFRVFGEIIRRKNLSAESVAYIGDDSNDLEIMQHAGLSACPSDACNMIRQIANLVMDNKGGDGAFREFAEILISFKQKSR